MIKDILLDKSISSFFEEWNKLPERFEKFITPVEIETSQMQKYMESLSNSQTIKEIDKQYLIEQYYFRERLEAKISQYQYAMILTLFNLPSKIKDTLVTMGNNGWYIDMEMPFPFIWKLKKALIEGNIKDVEVVLVEYFEGHLERITKYIIGRFPKRKKIFRAAFSAHKRGEYFLSIPVFLAQTDGICKEIVDKYLFRKHNKKPEIAAYVDEITSDTFKAALLSPLASNLPIGASEKERDSSFNQLNRHMVLHGESIDYGTKTNSLRAISLINYVTRVLENK